MLNLGIEDFGKPINLGNSGNVMGAHSMISQFLNIKNNYQKDLEALTDGDNHACRFFCYDDCAYIFNVDILEALVAAIRSHKPGTGSGCVVLFQGVRKEKDKITPANGCNFGRPTLIATAYFQHENGDIQYTPVDYPLSKNSTTSVDGFEHPGNGNSGAPYPLNEKIADSEMTSPVVEKNKKEDGDTDFQIIKYFKSDDFKWG